MQESLRREVWRRAEDTCEYCRMPQAFDPLPFQLDHIIAEQHHGPTTLENLGLSCLHCNKRKGPNLAGIDPSTGALTRLFQPRLDVWTDHFEWDGPYLRGRKDVGRTTIDVLDINRITRVMVRKALMEAGVFAG